MRETYAKIIKHLALKEGFQSVGIAKAMYLEEDAPLLEKWLKKGMHGEMKYMENYFDKRLDPSKLVEGCKSIISLSYNYYPNNIQNKLSYKIAKYAYGEDYHFVIKEKLQHLILQLQEEIGEFSYRIFVDSAPVLEKAWAKKSGLGWVGKNTNLITKPHGSFYFLAEIMCDLELEYDKPTPDYCGSCTKCIDACPTDAITEPYVVDGSKCISYFTIELKEEIPIEMKDKFQDWMFGCDICQDVCPWNRFSTNTLEEKFQPTNTLLSYSKKDWHEITEEVYNEIFKKSAIKRAKFTGLKRNITFLNNENI